jgi:prepilin-type N-terminal cleavage/methylation domain-containing protein
VARRPCRRAAGFTLIEALVVMAIIGIVAAVSIPSLQRARIRASMLDVVRTVEQAVAVSRITAIKRGQNVCLRFLDDGDRQQLTSFHAWIDTNANEVEDSGEETLGPWQIRRASEWSFEDVGDAFLPMYVLNKGAGGDDRGLVFLPSGMAITSDTTRQEGVGQGAFDYFIWQDGRRWNIFRITVFGGAGTVQARMWNPSSSSWDSNFAHWEYY